MQHRFSNGPNKKSYNKIDLYLHRFGILKEISLMEILVKN